MLLTGSWDYFWLLILIVDGTSWLNIKVMAHGHFQSQPKLDTIDTININQALTARLDNQYSGLLSVLDESL